ncbi:MAG TPA: isoleucine--tRNA ligase [Solirubrobacteraceae bacterium]|nr:isoleucine--tRNA ligase [Solirubrobacteraceae bacterium]
MSSSRKHPLVPPRPVDARRELPDLELEVLQRWRDRGVFKRSLQAREGAQPWVFYEGPPTANGRPGSHHVLSRVFKDIYPRYKTMRGYRVDRKGGWDCHGLPVEIGVEEQLGLTSKKEVEDYGIEAFNVKCRESVFTYLQEWDRLTERIGFWIDLDDAYRTLDESYIESVWWALAQIDAKGLLYEGHKVVPYCPRCGTALSSHEVALGYKDVVDPSVYVKLRLTDSDESLLIWTTTPWTLPGNVAVAVGPRIEYAKVRFGDETFILAAALVEKVLGDQAEVIERLTGADLIGRTYEGPIFDIGPRCGLPVIAGDFVTTEDGTGLVHIAPAFGEDDFDVAGAAGLIDATDPSTLFNPVALDGTYTDRVVGYEGRFVKDPALTEELIADLKARGLLLRRADYEHSYPHCWRCGTPLIYYAKASWYIRTTAVKEAMLAGNETVSWHPSHIKHGRFGEWLKGNVDWALSRERYWGTPLPVWRCAAGHLKVIGSFADLARLSGKALTDHHRPYVDEVEISCESCGEPMRRVPEVIDVWFDSGAMPFAQHHAPFERQDVFQEHFPADFVCEALDQTRGWFYSLLAVSTLLFEQAPYRNVVCLGLILDAEGQKMSKSKGNTVEPWQVLDEHGADAFRWYFFTSKQPWDGYRFSQEAIGEGVRLFLKQLWSTYFFYVLYANANAPRLEAAPHDLDLVAGNGQGAGSFGGDHGAELDRWALSRTAGTAELVAQKLDDYDATAAGRAIAELLDDLSNWYVRRSRRRFWDGEPAAFATLRQCLLIVSKLLAPFCPFIADEVYDNLDGTLPSVHLCDFPIREELPARDVELEEAMATARQTVRLGRGARAKAKAKVRQPLAEAVVVADGLERAAIERLSEIVRDELNVRRVRFVDAAEELGRYEVKANYRRLGPIFGKDMPLAADAIAALDPQRVAGVVLSGENGGALGISVAGREHTLNAEDVILTMSAPDGYAVEREGAHAVALDLVIDDDLRREGQAREIVHAVQNARKNAGLEVEDRISLVLSGDRQLLSAAAAHRDYLKGETLTIELDLAGEAQGDSEPSSNGGVGESPYRESASIDGLELSIALAKLV